MAIPVARVHLKMAHAALPALLPTPPKWTMMPLLPTPPCVVAILPKPPLTKPGCADSDERWDAHKAKPPACPASSASSSSGPCYADIVSSSAAGHGSSPRKNASSPPPKPGRADSAGRWDAHNKTGIPASLLSSGTSSLVSSTCKISRASSTERWDVHKKKRCAPRAKLEPLDDGESSSTGSNDDIDDMQEEILWKPRAMYAGPGLVAAAPEPRMLAVPTAFLVSVA